MIDLQTLSRADENNFENFLFYDIEVFKENTILVFKDIENNLIGCYYNGSVELDNPYYTYSRNFREINSLVKGKVLVGYNNYNYDDIVVSCIMGGHSQRRIKEVNDEIIAGLKPFPLNTDIFSLDCFQQINVAKSSLKKVEANIGMDIEETSVPFDIDRSLTEEELLRTIEYCSHDVDATINVFKLRWYSYFVAKLQVTAMLPKSQQMRAIRWNTTTITANLLTGGKNMRMWGRPYMASRESHTPEQLQEAKEMMFSRVPKEVQENWDKRKISKITINDFGCSFEFGQGGLHGVPEGKATLTEGNVKLLDVTSLYPNIILHLDALGEYTPKYKQIVDQRISIKHKDPILSDALKLVINSTYGLMKNDYSKLKNKNGALAVCIYGQIVLYDLCRRLKEEGNYNLININTDGVAFNAKGEIWKDFNTIKEEWEDDFGFSLELSEFDKWVQKDVNNYIAVNDGYIKVKGGQVNHYHDPLDYQSIPIGENAGVTWSGTNSLGIVHRVLVEVMTKYERYEWESAPIQSIVDKYIYDDPQPILFQYILQAGNTYIGVFDGDGKQYQKVNRVFAAKKDGVTLYKHKEIENGEGEKVISKQLFPNAPQTMYVYNKELKDFSEFQDVIDKSYYIDLIKEKLELWI